MKNEELYDIWKRTHNKLMKKKKVDLVNEIIKLRLLFFGSKLYKLMKPLVDYANKQSELKE